MPESIEEYVQHLLTLVAHCLFVSNSNIELDKRTLRSGLIRGEVGFEDRSRLYFRELVTVGQTVTRVMYSFHYQSDSSRLIFRYDDTAHHRQLAGFPHHKHEGSEKNVVQAAPPDLQVVLREVERIIEMKRSR